MRVTRGRRGGASVCPGRPHRRRRDPVGYRRTGGTALAAGWRSGPSPRCRPSSLDLAGTLAGFHADHPAVDISLTVANTDDLVEALQTGRIDIAVVGVGTGMPDGIAIEVITSEVFVAVVSHTDPLAKKTTITLRALCRAGADQPADRYWHAFIARCCLRRGRPRRPGSPSRRATPVWSPSSRPPASGSESCPSRWPMPVGAALHTVAITRPTLQGEVALAWRDRGPISPATRALVDRLRQAIAYAAQRRPFVDSQRTTSVSQAAPLTTASAGTVSPKRTSRSPMLVRASSARHASSARYMAAAIAQTGV